MVVNKRQMFRPGDRVVCVDDGGKSAIHNGQNYIINKIVYEDGDEKYGGWYVCVEGDPHSLCHYQERFILVERPLPDECVFYESLYGWI